MDISQIADSGLCLRSKRCVHMLGNSNTQKSKFSEKLAFEIFLNNKQTESVIHPTTLDNRIIE